MPPGAAPQSMKKLDCAATVRERLRQSAGLPLPDGRGSDFCYFSREPSMPHGGTTKDENYSPFEGGAGGCPRVNMALESRRTPPYAPLDRGDL